MVEIDDKIISEELFDEFFCCDLSQCKGICCVEGDSGAPLTIDEIDAIEDEFERVRPFMTKEGVEAVERDGVFEVDGDGDYTTTLVEGKECAYVVMENGIALCAMEKAFRAGKSTFMKPISCHLYPIRVKEFSNGMVGLNYHHWDVCSSAVCNGRKSGVKVYQSLKTAIERAFGEEFYEHLVEVDNILTNKKVEER
ncbi:MAG: DUF3109 family protein [Rikenellaceae bacterium]